MTTILKTDRTEVIGEEESSQLGSTTLLNALLSREVGKNLQGLINGLAEKRKQYEESKSISSPTTPSTQPTESTTVSSVEETAEVLPVEPSEPSLEEKTYAQAIIAAMAAMSENLSNTINKSSERTGYLNELADSSLDLAKANLKAALHELQDYLKWELTAQTTSLIGRIAGYVAVIITWAIAIAISVVSFGTLACLAIFAACAATTFLILDETGQTEKILEDIAAWIAEDVAPFFDTKVSEEDAMYWALGIWVTVTIVGPIVIGGLASFAAKAATCAGTVASAAQTARAAADGARLANLAGNATEVATAAADAAKAARAAADAARNVALTASNAATKARTATATGTVSKAADQADAAADVANRMADVAENAADAAENASKALTTAVKNGTHTQAAVDAAADAAQDAADCAAHAAAAADKAERATTIVEIASHGGKFTAAAEKMMRSANDAQIDDMARVGSGTLDDVKSLDTALDTVSNTSANRMAFTKLSPVLGPEKAARVINAMTRFDVIGVLLLINAALGLVQAGASIATAVCQFKMGMIKLAMSETQHDKTMIQATTDLIDAMIDKENGTLATQMNALSQMMGNAKTILSRQQQHITHYMG